MRKGRGRANRAIGGLFRKNQPLLICCTGYSTSVSANHINLVIRRWIRQEEAGGGTYLELGTGAVGERVVGRGRAAAGRVRRRPAARVPDRGALSTSATRYITLHQHSTHTTAKSASA